MNLGHCLLQAGHIDEALKCYYKVEYLDEKSNRALRPIAWCEFELGNYEQSRKYYNKVISNNPNAQDYMNFGHLELASKNLSLALSLYANSIKNSSKEEFRLGASDATGTHTTVATRPSNVPVYQFQHTRICTLLR